MIPESSRHKHTDKLYENLRVETLFSWMFVYTNKLEMFVETNYKQTRIE